MHKHFHHSRAFSLVELAIVLVFIGLIGGYFLTVRGRGGESDCIIATKDSMNTIKEALSRFEAQHERLPRPALRQLDANSPEFGREADDKLLNHYVSGFTKISFGALPFQVLGLSASYAGDCWQNKFTYVVTTSLTDADKYRSVPPGLYYEGQIEAATSNDGAIAAKVSQLAYAVISHGANGDGAAQISLKGTDSKFIKKATSALESGNYDIGDARIIDAPTTGGESDKSDNAFDDLVIYAGRKHVPINGKCRFTHEERDRGKCAQGIPADISSDCSSSPYRDVWKCDGLFGGIAEEGCYSKRTASCS